MFYAIFILMYIISSSNCIRIIGLPDNTEPYYNNLGRMEQLVYNIASRTQNETGFQRRYYMYAMQANPTLFNNARRSISFSNANAQLIYNHIKQSVMNNINIVNQRILTYNQWLEVLDIYSNAAFYHSLQFAQARNRIPEKPPRESQSAYNRLCSIIMTGNRNLYENTINAFFAPHILPPELETQESRHMRITYGEVMQYFNNMCTCQDITWLKQVYNDQLLICESYLSYALRTIHIGKMPIPKSSIPSIYNAPADFNPFINMENFDLKAEGLIDSNRDACVFMFILVNIKDDQNNYD